eukprot:TRINITY_DN23125_c0_g1_i1.p2 TRINITY_DN23125_c0_g1~~TRINITY_DN23125_c0_g1_i1.p2  ORF type:complete len:154 (-),score=7.19 TRINITY_DN23125_c0_g1_i1:143-604(-)
MQLSEARAKVRDQRRANEEHVATIDALERLVQQQAGTVAKPSTSSKPVAFRSLQPNPAWAVRSVAPTAASDPVATSAPAAVPEAPEPEPRLPRRCVASIKASHSAPMQSRSYSRLATPGQQVVKAEAASVPRPPLVPMKEEPESTMVEVSDYV